MQKPYLEAQHGPGPLRIDHYLCITTSSLGQSTEKIANAQTSSPFSVAVPADSTSSSLTDCDEPCVRTIVARQILYAHSCYDGSGQGCNPGVCAQLAGHTCTSDDAIDCFKFPQLPGSGPATFDNYSNYTRGINCITIDVQSGSCGCVSPIVTASMFTFTVGNVVDPTTPAPLPTSIVTNSLSSDTDRIKLFWPDFGQPDSLPNHQWLKVVVKSEANGGIPGLAADDVFYWGLAIGEDGTPNNSIPRRAVVDATDEIHARVNSDPKIVRIKLCTDPRARWDYDKSATDDGVDQLKSRVSATSFNALLLFTR